MNWTGSGNDLAGGQRLQRELARVQVTSAVAADVDDQPVLRQQGDESGELVPEADRVLHGEGEDPDLTEGAVGGGHRPGPEDRRHGGGDIGGVDGLRLGQLTCFGLLILQADDLGVVKTLAGPVPFVGIQVQGVRERGG